MFFTDLSEFIVCINTNAIYVIHDNDSNQDLIVGLGNFSIINYFIIDDHLFIVSKYEETFRCEYIDITNHGEQDQIICYETILQDQIDDSSNIFNFFQILQNFLI